MRVDKRTYIDKETTEKLIEYFNGTAIKKKEERQAIYTYHTESDFRLIRTIDYVKLDLKDINSENRVYINKLYESDMLNILKQIGMYVAVKRYRIRHMYHYKNFYITIDENIKYGNVLRIGFECNDEEKELYLNEINKIYATFSIKESSMDTFQELYGKYRTSWADLINDIDEEQFLKGEN